MGKQDIGGWVEIKRWILAIAMNANFSVISCCILLERVHYKERVDAATIVYYI